MPRAFKAHTLTDLHANLCESLVWARPDQLDVITSADVQIHDVMAVCDSMEWEFDLKDMWLTAGRWSMMVKQYVDPALLDVFMAQTVDRIGKKGRGLAAMRTRVVNPRGGVKSGNKETRRWGSCMLGFGYKALPTPTVTLWSRTSYLGYIGALDISVAWMLARQIGLEVGFEPKDVRFVWYNSALQWHNFKSLAYLLNNPDPVKRKNYRRMMMLPVERLDEAERDFITDFPTLRLTRQWLQKLIKEDREGKTYGDITYNTYRRIRRRYHTEVRGYEYAQRFEGYSHHKTTGEETGWHQAYKPLPSIKIQTRDLKAAGWSLHRRVDSDLELDDDLDNLDISLEDWNEDI